MRNLTLEEPFDLTTDLLDLLQFASLVSFEKNMPGYVRWQNFTSDGLQVNLKFKTSANDGLIFYAVDDDQSTNTGYLALENGRLVFISKNVELWTTPSDLKFNDNEWHVVTVTQDQSDLSLDIDDTNRYSSKSPPPLPHFQHGNLYIGGLPSRLDPDGTAVPFVGCIGDATLNGEIIINFANSTERPRAFLGKCKGGDQTRTLRHGLLLFAQLHYRYYIFNDFSRFSAATNRRVQTSAIVATNRRSG